MEMLVTVALTQWEGTEQGGAWRRANKLAKGEKSHPKSVPYNAILLEAGTKPDFLCHLPYCLEVAGSHRI